MRRSRTLDTLMPDAAPNTRERILDIALDLFTTQGYEKTSLREIAGRLGFSKAAIYYHFASKDDILMALHLRLHALGSKVLSEVDHDQMTKEVWVDLLNRSIQLMLENRALFILHERNRTALEHLHSKGHDGEHEDLEALLFSALSDPGFAIEDRVRAACAFGAIAIGMGISGDTFSDVPSAQLERYLKDTVADIMHTSRTSEA